VRLKTGCRAMSTTSNPEPILTNLASTTVKSLMLSSQ
jgi:hypothetical protein